MAIKSTNRHRLKNSLSGTFQEPTATGSIRSWTACVSVYREQLDEDGQVDFKGKAKAFLRAYGFLAAILPYTVAEWEKLSIFLTFLVPKLPAPEEDDFSKGILEAIDMDSYRVEKQAVQDIQLPDEDAEIGPVPTEGGRAEAGTGDGPTLQHREGVQRPIRQHRVEGPGQD